MHILYLFKLFHNIRKEGWTRYQNTLFALAEIISHHTLQDFGLTLFWGLKQE